MTKTALFGALLVLFALAWRSHVQVERKATGPDLSFVIQ